jgi:hypothetical protein
MQESDDKLAEVVYQAIETLSWGFLFPSLVTSILFYMPGVIWRGLGWEGICELVRIYWARFRYVRLKLLTDYLTNRVSFDDEMAKAAKDCQRLIDDIDAVLEGLYQPSN